MIVVNVIQDPGDHQMEIAAQQVLFRMDSETCSKCTEVYQETNALPMHCPRCGQIRAEHWAQQIQKRARSLVLSGGAL
jgi:predicted RNA-binding Zn-ribbon protein involved in translation (DUF1610 family)